MNDQAINIDKYLEVLDRASTLVSMDVLTGTISARFINRGSDISKSGFLITLDNNFISSAAGNDNLTGFF